MSDEALSSNDERFVREQFPLLSALSSHNGNELQNEAMALISMAANLRRELAELETSLAIYKGRDEGKQLVINQLERHRDLLESNLKSFVAHAARGSEPPVAALRDALEAIASPSRHEDYGWWTQVARRALGYATRNETAQPPDDVLQKIRDARRLWSVSCRCGCSECAGFDLKLVRLLGLSVTKIEHPAVEQSAANSEQCVSRKAAQSGTAAGSSDETGGSHDL